MRSVDFLIIGGGVVGLSIAKEIQKSNPQSLITVIEKEASLAKHASGRNSGVLHSGIYYPEDSLKARFTRDGNAAWQEYCLHNNLSVKSYGKLVIATSESEALTLETLMSRGRKNNVEIEYISATDVARLEPSARRDFPALYVPSTSTIDPLELINALKDEFLRNGGQILYKCHFLNNLNNNIVDTNLGKISAGFVINCAGLYADRVAHSFGFGLEYTILPFKGLYLYAESNKNLPKMNIYPVPNLNNPFLGVHFTRTVDGKIKIGPTAIPAFWRENYGGFSGFRVDEFMKIMANMLQLFITNKINFRSLAIEELKKQRKKYLVNEAKRLLNNTDTIRFGQWGEPGIRAQLLDHKRKQLEMDFVVQGDNRSMHILNAVSPAFTCALPFAAYVVDQIFEHKE